MACILRLPCRGKSSLRRQSLARAREFRRRLLRWFRRHGRDLPWRRTRDPYQVLVSEVMLQQTQVSRVEEYYHRFLERFPTLQAPRRPRRPRAVRESWDGLGYYRRAANLHRLARMVVRDHDGRDSRRTPTSPPAPPRRRDATPRARCRASPSSVATPAVDTNVARVHPPRLPSPRATRRPRGRRTSGTTAERLLPRPGPRRVDVQSGHHGAGSAGLYRAGGALRGLPGARRVRHGAAEAARRGGCEPQPPVR